MRERTLLAIALLSSVVGLSILTFFAHDLEPSEADLKIIDGMQSGKQVKVLGQVQDVIAIDSTVILTISQPSTVKVVAFGMASPPEEGETLEIIGHIDDYEGENEIIADRIRLVDGG